MTREEAKAILGEGTTDVQVTNFLNNLHTKENEIKKLQEQINGIDDIQNQLNDYKSQIDAINQEKLTETEKLEQMKQETIKNLSDSKKVLSKAKAKEILIDIEGLDESIIDSLVDEDINITTTKATALANQFKTVREQVEKSTKESMFNQDMKPAGSNNPNDENAKISKDDFKNLTIAEKTKIFNEDKDLWNKLTEN